MTGQKIGFVILILLSYKNFGICFPEINVFGYMKTLGPV